ncbi:hypothetical protein [Phocaeicola sartorii]|uniref:hypothetical protein n=1 Tax=Phocaeicola sartorii TaxID=671267 RepID=UPI003F694C93
MHGGRRCVATTDYTDGVLIITVEDTGTGMTNDEQQRVFGAFERFVKRCRKGRLRIRSFHCSAHCDNARRHNPAGER